MTAIYPNVCIKLLLFHLDYYFTILQLYQKELQRAFIVILGMTMKEVTFER